MNTHADASFPVMTMTEIAALCKRNFRRYEQGVAPQSIIILGGPGSGKTHIMVTPSCLPTWYAEHLSEKTDTLITVDDILVSVVRVAEKDGQEIAGPGVPFEDEDGNFMLRFSRAPTLSELAEARHEVDGEMVPYRYFIIVLDELSSSNADTQKVVANMLHSDDHSLGGDELPLGTFVCGTGNLPQDGAGANRLLSHLVDRPKVIRTKPDGESWVKDFAEPNAICPIIIEFGRQHWREVIVDTPPMEYGNYCTFRSLTETSYDVASLISDRGFNGSVPSWAEAEFASNIGCKAARLLSDFIEKAGEVATPEEIFANAECATVSNNIGYQYVSASMVLGAVTNMSEATSALTYVMRLRTDLIVSVGRKLHDVLANPDFTDTIMTSDIWMRFQKQYGEYLTD
jgi:hypothetical protein